jgi:hypothetical protein
VTDIWVVDQFAGVRSGTKTNPYVATSATDFDLLHQSFARDDEIALHWEGRFKTKGSYRWGRYAAANWRAGPKWSIEGSAEVELEPDLNAMDSEPLFVVAWWPDGVAPRIEGVTLVGNHSKYAERWREAGLMFRTGAVLEYGRGLIDGVMYRDFGATRAPGQPKSVSSETFVAEIVGSGTIRGGVHTGYDPASSDDQVTVNRIIGSENGERVTDEPCVIEGCQTTAAGENQVQAHTIYWATQGVIRKNVTRGVNVAVYGDWGVTKGIAVTENDFEARAHGVQLKLSPGYEFSHEGYVIGMQRMVTGGANVSLDCVTPPTAKRFIRDIAVDVNLSLENVNEWAERVTRPGVDLSRRRGCRWL